ncbi:MAG: VOC family protein [Bacteroidota bacterium]
MANSINWFEIPVADEKRGLTFYQSLYEQDLHKHDPGDGTSMYFLPCTGEVGGALVFGEGYEPANTGTIVYLNGGDDLQVMLDRVEPAGGSVEVPKTLIGDEMGYFAIFRDTEGNRVGLHSPN